MTASVLIGIVACQQLIGLGDEPELAPEDGGTALEYKCNIPPPSGPKCRGCVEEECCDQMIACSEDSVCREAMNCMQLCYELGCINACLEEADNEKLQAFFDCNLQRCAPTCAIKDDCLRLASNCCDNVDKTVRSGCMSVAQGEDQELCLETIDLLSDDCDEQ